MGKTAGKGWFLESRRAWIAARWLALLVVLVGAGGAFATEKGAEGTPPQKTLVTTEVYSLKTQDPVSLAEVLGKLAQGMAQDKEAKEEKVVIAPDKATRSVIVRANRENQEWIAKLIARLDKRPPQLLIDVTMVEITNHDRFDYDLNFIRNSAGLAGTVAPTNIAQTDKPVVGAPRTSGSLSAIYSDRQINALLSTVQEKRYGHVLAKPKLLVNDHQKGEIETRTTIYAEGSSGKCHPYDAGIALGFTPHILERKDLLQLDIVIARSDFLKHASAKPPDTQFSRVDTSVVLPDGCTVILGGMLKQNKAGAKVPVLGDLPLLGGLFRSDHDEQAESYLYLLVKAEIIPVDEPVGVDGLKVLSERQRAAFEKREREFQAYQDLPGVKPKWIDPPPVLKAP